MQRRTELNTEARIFLEGARSEVRGTGEGMSRWKICLTDLNGLQTLLIYLSSER